MIGKKYGRLTVIGEVPRFLGDPKEVFVKCDCGTEKKIHVSNLKVVRSCGCLRVETSTQNGILLGKSNRKHKTCRICGDIHYAKGLCNKHYQAERNKRI